MESRVASFITKLSPQKMDQVKSAVMFALGFDD